MDHLTRPAWAPARRCVATNRSGERCFRQPIPGGDVCVMHGGRAPQTREAARRRLLAGADLAIDALLKVLEPRAPCEHCGRSDADRDPVVVRACQIVLDRAGFHPTLTVEHTTDHAYADLDVFQAADEAEALARMARQMANDEAARLAAAKDAEIIDEDRQLVEAITNDDIPNPSGNGTPEKRTAENG